MTSPVTKFNMSVSCTCSSPLLIILSVSIILLSISIAFLSYSIISFQKRSNVEFASRLSDTSKMDDQSPNSNKEDEKHRSGSPMGKSMSVSSLEGDEEPGNINPPENEFTRAGSGDTWTCCACHEIISVGLQCYRCEHRRDDYCKSSLITSSVKKSTRAGSGKIWICGHCDVGYMTMILETHCNRCWRRRDAYSSIFPECLNSRG